MILAAKNVDSLTTSKQNANSNSNGQGGPLNTSTNG